MVSFFHPRTAQNHQQPGQCFPVELTSVHQQGWQFDAAPTHKRNVLTAVKVFVATMYRKGLLNRNSLEGIELPSIGRALPKALFSADEIERILA